MSTQGGDFSTVFISLLIGIALASFIYRYRRTPPLPPGPTRWPVVGSAFGLPKEHEWLTYERWSQEHGSGLLYYSSWGKPFVIINSHEVAVDLLERRSAIYADRPRMHMLNDLCGWGWDLGLLPYGDDWKLARKLFTQHFRQAASVRYRDEETRCARELVRDIMRDQTQLYEHVRLLYGKLIMSVTYGIDVRSADDPYITIARKALYAINVAGNVGTYLVDSIPALKYVPTWFPGAQFKRDAREWKKCATAMAHKPYEAVRAAMKSGTAKPSVLKSMLEELGEDLSHQQEKAAISATGTAYEAASETAWSASLTVILAMVLFPDTQRKAQEELDRAVGRERLPEFSDLPSLPYITAICMEAVRWRPPLPLAVMHRVTKDDLYQGYRIPGGSTVVLNSWALLHDPARYPDPDVFRPERYLTPSGALDPSAPEPVAGFGFGRRACPGSFMAQDTLWIAAASLLWAFRMERAIDAAGRPIEISGEYTVGVVSYPAPFEYALNPRAESLLSLAELVVPV
ncbi:cytochrome P450 [Phanerochaete sordida]|uniref:Cytochrome P450 n=1 Tax=Phanerochaete sordida TaxID=48140 RepID=A0A9P3GPY0_9APHY|nr:cytochrome P450 [Phanerochaete sordida]